MTGQLMYEIARQRMAERQRAAEMAGDARRQRAAARGRHHRPARDESVVPAIPDFADDLLAAARQAVPVPREEAAGGHHARSAR
jgi:hypothetical protein